MDMPGFFALCGLFWIWINVCMGANPIVDLEYEMYEGYYNSTAELNIFKGFVKLASALLNYLVTHLRC